MKRLAQLAAALALIIVAGCEAMDPVKTELTDTGLKVPADWSSVFISADRMIRPTLGALMNTADQSCPGVARDRLQLCCHSLVSQLVHALQMQRLHARSEWPFWGHSLLTRTDTKRGCF